MSLLCIPAGLTALFTDMGSPNASGGVNKISLTLFDYNIKAPPTSDLTGCFASLGECMKQPVIDYGTSVFASYAYSMIAAVILSVVTIVLGSIFLYYGEFIFLTALIFVYFLSIYLVYRVFQGDITDARLDTIKKVRVCTRNLNTCVAKYEDDQAAAVDSAICAG